MSDGERTPKRRPTPEAANDDAHESAADAADERAAGETDEAAGAELEDAAETLAEADEAEPAPPTPEEQIAELKDQLLRAMAETENVRRRAQRELEDARKYAIGDFARELLTLADNLDRAIASAGANQGSLLEGVELSRRQFLQALEKFAIRPIEAEGQKLDPHLHQAMLQVETDEVEPGTIVQVMQTGYTIHDRLLRPALVGVAKAPEAPAEAAEAPPDGEA